MLTNLSFHRTRALSSRSTSLFPGVLSNLIYGIFGWKSLTLPACVITYLPVALHWDLECACHCVLPLHKGHSLRLRFGFVMQMLQLRGIKKSEAEIADHHQKKMPFFVCSEVTAELSELLCLVYNQRLIPVNLG